MTDDQSAGATPVEPGATPGQSPDPTAATPAAAPPATGDDGLADAGRRALDAERTQRRDAEKRAKSLADELEALKAGQLSEHEKAVAAARREAQTETERAWSARLRRSEVRRELAAAGAAVDLVDELARSEAFSALEIDDDGNVVGLAKAVSAYRAERPSAFAAPRAAAGNVDGGASGGSAAATYSRDSIGAMSQAEYERSERDILAAAREGRIRD